MPTARPATASVTPAELGVLLGRAGLTLNPGQTADLVLVWRQLSAMAAALPRDRPLADDQAFVFRLPPPAAPARRAVKTPPARSAVKTPPARGAVKKR
jgi:hypothetical protein